MFDVGSKEQKKTTLDMVRCNRPLVIDFWNTRCVKCPGALTKMDALAANFLDRATFAACAFSLNSTTEGTIDHVTELVADAFPNLRQLYMEFETKEALKAVLEFNALPFAAVYDSDGILVCKGDPTVDAFATSLHAFLQGLPVIDDRATQGGR